MQLTPHAGAVHPRWVWSAVTSCVTGIVVLGLGIMFLSWWTGIVGVVLLGLGTLTGFRAGWMYDVHATRSAPAEIDEVEEGGTHEGITPGDMVDDPQVRRTATNLDAQRTQLMARAATTPAPLADLGAGVLLLVAVVLLVAQWTVYPHNATGQGNGLHSTYVAIVVALVGLRVLTGRGTPHPLAAGVGALSGVVLLLLAVLAPHSGAGVAVFEGICAIALVLGSAACLSWREAR